MIVFSLAFVVTSFLSAKEKELRVVEDLKPTWQTVSASKPEKYSGEPTQIVRLPINLTGKQGCWLRVHSEETFFLFINTALVAQGKQLLLRADSLRKLYPEKFYLSIYQKKNIGNLTTQWVSFSVVDRFYNPPRPANSFSNFILTASLLLLIFFVALFRTNPQLALDYLNVTKLFSLRDRYESQITLRIASSVNLLFYFFGSLLASLALLVASHFAEGALLFLSISVEASAGVYVAQWALMALAIFGVLMFKLGFAAAMALLFSWKEVAGFQFFNFVRVLMLSLAFIAVVSVFCFSFGIGVSYFNLLKTACALLVLGTGLLYFKLLARARFSPFHLFSYLCATEIFPLVILIKVLLF